MSQRRIVLQENMAWLVLVLGIILSVSNSIYVKRGIEQDAVNRLAFAADQVTSRIEERLDAYALVLRGASALFAASGGVSREQWRSYFDVLQVSRTLTGVQGIGFSLLIPRDQLAEHISSVRAEGFPDYQINPQGPRDIYTSIVYLEPFSDRNLRAFGYDMYSEAVRRVAMERARDTGQAALSGKVLLLQETDIDIQPGTLMYVPIYGNGTTLNSVSDRRSALIGWAYSPYRMTDLMSGILGEWEHVDVQALHLGIYDGLSATPGTLLFNNQAGLHQPQSSLLSQQRIINFNDNQWLLQFGRLDAATHLDYSLAATSLFTGIVVSILLFALVMTMARTKLRAERIANRLTFDITERDKQLQESEQRWRFAIEGAGDGLWDWNLVDNTVYISTRCKEMLGITGDVPDPVTEWEDRLHPEDKARVLDAFKDYLEGHSNTYATEQRLRCNDGTYKWIRERGSIISRTADGKPARVIGTWSDINERKLARIALDAAHTEAQLFRVALDYVDSYIYMKDTDRRYTYANKSTLELFGVSVEELRGRSDSDFFPPAMVERLHQIDSRVLSGERTREEIEKLNPDGTRNVYLEIKTPIVNYTDKTQINGLLGISTDITVIKEYQNELEHMAHHDSLTRLPNRILLVDRLTQAMAQSKRRDKPLALVYLDLDGFKLVNDEFGHQAGDDFLVTVSRRMQSVLRQEDTLARVGGDEFVVMMVDSTDKNSLQLVLKRLMDTICEPIIINGKSAQVAASMGVVLYPQVGDVTPDQLLHYADQTMYKAKQDGKHRAYLYGDSSSNNGGLLAQDLGV